MKRFAVVTDLHGNDYALQAVLEELENEEIREVYCLGDILSIGHQSKEVLQRLQEYPNLHLVLGNHDEYILAIHRGEAVPEDTAENKAHHEWVYRQIDDRLLDWLANKQRSLVLEENGHSIRLLHYHIPLEHNGLHISQSPYAPIHSYPTPVSYLQELFAPYQENLVLFGHTHVTAYWQTDQQQVRFNPGALGVSHDRFARYGVIELEKGQIRCHLKKVPYDRERYIQELQNAKMPASIEIFPMFFGVKYETKNI
ncbi:metallophosphoesterase family protein [Risungbinella massiliensis]|uniref:metallophosphoesterase family protein n=1 Tax=Risungbinella massiliensis TaxID=1329796 RepID=UPI0005CC0F99|nr:metallophosphoesterase family protein [Risungbinella massiliensis]